jgi:DNA-binding transcriptional regulator YiaG
MTKTATRRQPALRRETHGLSAGDHKRAAALAAWQTRHGLTQVAAAKALGIPVQTYRNWIKGRYPVSPMAEKLCGYIDRGGLIDG